MLQEKYLNGVRIISLDKKKFDKKIKKTIKKILKENGNILKIILFGSFAKGNYMPDSDIDICIVLKETEKKFIERQDDFINYFLEFPLYTNIIVYTKEEFEKGDSNFIKEIKESGKVLYENPNP